MKRLMAIALYTFRDAIRNKILYSIIFFAIVLIVLSMILGSASMAQDQRFIVDIGFQSINVFLDMIAILLGVTTVYQEMEKKTIYSLLSKPVNRYTYFAGKFLGTAITLGVQLLIMSIFLSVAYVAKDGELDRTYFFAIWLTYVECLLVAAIALFFSSFSTPYVSGFLSLGVFLAGRLVQELEAFLPSFVAAADASSAESLSYRVLTPVLRGLVQIAPDLNLFTLSTQITQNIDVTFTYLMEATGYGVAYALVFLLSGAWLFQRRDFI